MPQLAILFLNLFVIGVLAAFAYFLKWAGWKFALGLTVGFFACYFYYRCWEQDDERRPHFTD